MITSRLSFSEVLFSGPEWKKNYHKRERNRSAAGDILTCRGLVYKLFRILCIFFPGFLQNALSLRTLSYALNNPHKMEIPGHTY